MQALVPLRRRHRCRPASSVARPGGGRVRRLIGQSGSLEYFGEAGYPITEFFVDAMFNEFFGEDLQSGQPATGRRNGGR